MTTLARDPRDTPSRPKGDLSAYLKRRSWATWILVVIGASLSLYGNGLVREFGFVLWISGVLAQIAVGVLISRTDRT
jgi:hypothetical protein